jgi:large subunit ribosomal protein L32e
LRTGTRRYKRLGKSRKKLQRWRRPRGRDNKIRERRKNRGLRVAIGYRSKKDGRGKVEGQIPIMIKNLRETEKIEKGALVIISKVGKKKRIEIEKNVKEKGGKILNQLKEKKENEPKK